VAGEVALEAADGFAVGLAFGAFAGDVVLGLGVAAQPRDGDAVDRRVDLAVAAAVEPVPAGLARADRDRGDAGGPGELGVSRESLRAGDLAMDTSSEGLATALHKSRSGRSVDRATAGAWPSSRASASSSMNLVLAITR
jgi:hypothetical protein